MTRWYVKELSKLTQVSVRTLHHYDELGLLKPSVRLDNGYRSYSESDLLRLQQIIALKFFGFDLTQIKSLITEEAEMVDQFSVQAQLLEEKAKTLLQASAALRTIMAECDNSKSIPWETIIKSIEVYRMTQELEKTWAGRVLSTQELTDYSIFLKSRSEQEKKKFERDWANLVSQVGSNLDKEPTSDDGVALGQRCMELVNLMYGKEHATLRKAIWEKGFKNGQIDQESALSPQMVDWLDKAIDAYYRKRIYWLLNQIESDSAIRESKEWEELLEEMFGNSDSSKQAVVDTVMKDDKVSLSAKNWLRGSVN